MENKQSGKSSKGGFHLTEEQTEMMDLFVQALPFLRKEIGVTQTELGHKIGRSRQTISYIERGTYPLSWETFLSLIYFFRVNNGVIPENKRNIVDQYMLLRDRKPSGREMKQ